MVDIGQRTMENEYLCHKLLALTLLLACLIAISAGEKVLASVPNVGVLLSDAMFMEVLRPEDVRYTYKIRLAKNFGAPFTQRYYGIELTLGEPNHGCSRFTNEDELVNTVVFVTRGECSFVTKTINAQDAGALAVVIADNDKHNDQMSVDMVDDNTNRLVTIPAAFLMGKDGFMIKNSLERQGLSYALINIPINITGVAVHQVQHPPWTLW